MPNIEKGGQSDRRTIGDYAAYVLSANNSIENTVIHDPARGPRHEHIINIILQKPADKKALNELVDLTDIVNKSESKGFLKKHTEPNYIEIKFDESLKKIDISLSNIGVIKFLGIIKARDTDRFKAYQDSLQKTPA